MLRIHAPRSGEGCVASLEFILLTEELINLNLDLDLDLNLSPQTFRSELARINPINIETIWYS